MTQKIDKNSSPRVKVIQKIYGYLLNPDQEIVYPKNQYKKYIKDVVSGTLERIDLIEETIEKNISEDIYLSPSFCAYLSQRFSKFPIADDNWTSPPAPETCAKPLIIFSTWLLNENTSTPALFIPW